MGLFQKNQPVGVQLSQKQIYENNYNGTRGNILLVVLFTAINIVLLISNSNTYFLFSAFIPYALVDVGRYICGMYPSEYYDGMQYMTFYQKEVFVVMLIVAVVILVVYTLWDGENYLVSNSSTRALLCYFYISDKSFN